MTKVIICGSFDAARSRRAEQHATLKRHPVNGNWRVRRDPFSVYRSGFEVRTYRLCHRILIFHHFPQELGSGVPGPRDRVLRMLTSPIASFISKCQQSGYVRSRSEDQPESLSPEVASSARIRLQQGASPRTPEQPSERSTPRARRTCLSVSTASYQWVDLDGEGISGILTNRPTAGTTSGISARTTSCARTGTPRARFGPLELVASKPSIGLAGGAQCSILPAMVSSTWCDRRSGARLL